ncbi:MAG: phenylalanine--tRNA ligase subunit beta [Acidimicrobiia bacterium]|nr:phenylalanine--tRNA ligase subunit beta [Acidimicrobiia bacterium]
MKVSLNWLGEYIDLPTSDVTELTNIFANLGHEVEGVEVLEPQFRDVVIGKVLTVQPHPDADKVRLCSVDTGNGPTDIICGAWNFEAGATVPVAVPGAVLGEDFLITKRDIRGVTSNGMICSAKELGLGDDADGIMVLADDLPIGTPFVDHIELPDVVFDLAITPNRPDAMSMVGLARELAAHFEITYRVPSPELGVTAGEMDLRVDIEDDRCRRFVAREVRGVEVRSAPLWMAQRLVKAGVRSISNIVDISNYVMLELGQPTHAFDRDKVADGHIVVRAATEGETLVTLDGVQRQLTPEDLLVADIERGSSLAGTMGGLDSEVSESTTNVLIECASWDPPTVMRMSRRHGLRSEASARFERGVDPNLPPLAADRMAEMIAAHAGGFIVAGMVDNYPVPIEPHRLRLAVSEVHRILGIPLSKSEVAGLLARLNFAVSADGKGDDDIDVAVPTNRPDVTRPIDLIEEVARLHGFDNFPSRVPTGGNGGLSVEQMRLRSLRWVARGAGFSEAHTSTFSSHADLAMLGLPLDDYRSQTIEVKNPLRDEESIMRTTLIPGLLGSARFNLAHGADSVALFETGKVFFNQESPELGTVPDQPDVFSFVAVGSSGPGDVAGLGRPVDVFRGMALWRSIVDQMGLGSSEIRQAELPGLHPGRGARVVLDGASIGQIGELHPAVARAFDLTGRVLVGELDLNPLVADPGLLSFVEPSVFPPSEFDLSFDVGLTTPAAALLSEASNAGGDLVESVEVFDEFLRGDAKAIGLRVTIRASDRTLTADDVADVRTRVIRAVTDKTGAKLRGG